MTPAESPYRPDPDSPAAAMPIAYEPQPGGAVLAVLPHPDDETFATGGTLARCADAGARVVYLCGTYGDMGRRMGRPPFATRESLRDLRQRELRAACSVLGVEVRYMGMRDKCIEFEDPQQVAEQILAVVTELNPTTVFTYYPGHGVHPDHDALAHATVLALRGLPIERRPQLLAVAVGERDALEAELGAPPVASDIRAVKERKLDALRAHRTQTQAMFKHWEDESEDADPQANAFRERMLETERFYVLDPDAPTLLES